jgi:hypothetical protein
MNDVRLWKSLDLSSISYQRLKAAIVSWVGCGAALSKPNCGLRHD